MSRTKIAACSPLLLGGLLLTMGGAMHALAEPPKTPAPAPASSSPPAPSPSAPAPTPAPAAPPAPAAVLVKSELDAKIVYCKTCHGLSGQGYRGALPMPRLAGQQPDYFQEQVRAFHERRRSNAIMANVARVLSPAMLSAIAAHFKDLNPRPLGGGPKDLIAAGKKIFEEGVPEAQIAACGSCHGADAKGDGAMPRLAGQLYDYTIETLSNWSKQRGQDPNKPDSSAIMQPIAQALTPQQTSAVAAYLDSLQ